jgi:multiple sugar transport system permease protein
MRLPVPKLVPLLLVGLLAILATRLNAQEIIENRDYDGPKVTIKYSMFGGADQVRDTRRMCEIFVERNPDIRVQLAVYPWGQYWAKIRTQAASGLAPDVLYLAAQQSGAWVSNGALMPLDDFIEKSGFDLSLYYEDIVDACRWDGQLYSLPLELPVAALVYSIDRFEERGIPRDQWPKPDVPLTWEKYVQLANQLTIRNPDGTFSQYGMGAGFDWEPHQIYLQGPRVVDRQINPTRATMADNEELVEAMKRVFRTQFVERVHMSSEVLRDATFNADTLLTRDQYAMTHVGTWALPILQQAGVRFGVSPTPRPEGAGVNFGFNSLGIFVGTKHPDEAFRFLSFMVSDEVMTAYGRALKGVPSLKSAANSIVDNAYGIPNCEAYLVGLDNGIPPLVTDKVQVLQTVALGYQRLAEAMDAEYQGTLRNLPRDANGAIPADAYEGFVKHMEGAVDRIVREHLQRMQREADQAFARAERTRPGFMVGTILPLLFVGGVILFVGLYFGMVGSQGEKAGFSGRSSTWVGYIVIGPWLIGFLFFTLGPMLASIWLSFTRWNMITAPEWIGAQHYMDLASDRYFTLGLRRTFLYALFVIPISLIGGLFTAGLLTADVRGRDFFKAIFYFPSLFTGAAAAVLWLNMFNRDFGVVNHVLGIVGIAPINWLGEQWAFTTVVLMNVFWIGGAMIIYYAGMKQIPQSLYEAADIDGANFVRKFISVTIPMLSPVILFMVVVSTINAFQVFTPALFFARSSDLIGEPGTALRFYSVNIYDEAFNNLSMGKACCWAFILFLIIFAVTMVQMKISKRFVHTGT